MKININKLLKNITPLIKKPLLQNRIPPTTIQIKRFKELTENLRWKSN